jgi:hypothetical protein
VLISENEATTPPIDHSAHAAQALHLNGRTVVRPMWEKSTTVSRLCLFNFEQALMV